MLFFSFVVIFVVWVFFFLRGFVLNTFVHVCVQQLKKLYGYSLTAPNTDLKPTVLPIRDETFVGAGVAIIGDPLNGDM